MDSNFTSTQRKNVPPFKLGWLMKPKASDVQVQIADFEHAKFAQEICVQMEASAKERGTGIARRNVEYIASKLSSGMAVIATNKHTGHWAGFCYIETWGDEKHVSNSGLIIVPRYRGLGLANKIKKMAFQLSRKKFPNAALFGLTTSEAVMNVNSKLGYKPVIFSSLTNDERFWEGCKTCKNYKVLKSQNFKNCFCTAMQWHPESRKSPIKKLTEKLKKLKTTLPEESKEKGGTK